MGRFHVAKRYGIFRHPAVRHHIAQLDAEQDCQQIVALLSSYEFPIDIQHALELALLYTYASPKVSRLLDRTREFADHGQKRYDDTKILIGLMLESGWDGAFGRQAIERINQTHSHYRIYNDEFLFVLWTFIDFPIRWTQQHSHRPMTAHEQAAWFNFWVGIGERMNIEAIPSSKAAFDQWIPLYRMREFHYDAANQRVTDATTRIIEHWLPRPLQPLVKWGVSGLMDQAFLYSVGYPNPSGLQKNLCHWTIKAYCTLRQPIFWPGYPMTSSQTTDRYARQQRQAIDQIQPDRLRQIKRCNSHQHSYHGATPHAIDGIS